jgi:metal-responsive CopG/Arc/MetJ family transcriptional regulator
MKILSIKLPEELIIQLDLLVKRKRYRSRNEALRTLIKKGLESESTTEFLDENSKNKIANILNSFKEKNVSFFLTGEKSAEQLVSEERER